jgi:hypothetical protein
MMFHWPGSGRTPFVHHLTAGDGNPPLAGNGNDLIAGNSDR